MSNTRHIVTSAMIFIGGLLVGVGTSMVVYKESLTIACTKLGIDTGKSLIEKFN